MRCSNFSYRLWLINGNLCHGTVYEPVLANQSQWIHNAIYMEDELERIFFLVLLLTEKNTHIRQLGLLSLVLVFVVGISCES